MILCNGAEGESEESGCWKCSSVVGDVAGLAATSWKTVICFDGASEAVVNICEATGKPDLASEVVVVVVYQVASTVPPPPGKTE